MAEEQTRNGQTATETIGIVRENDPENAGRKGKINNQDAIRKLKAKLVPGMRYTLLLSLIIYFAMLIVGILAVKKCPVNEDIPLFLCITGFVGLASKLVTYLRDRIIPVFKIKHVEKALYTTEVIFFILGTYWVYKEYKPSFNPVDGAKYCQKTAYLYAFIYLTVFYAILMAVLVITLCMCCCFCLGVTCFTALVDKMVKEDMEAESQVPYIDEEVKDNNEDQK